MLSPQQLAFAEAQRVARLATADAAGCPHAVPVCFAYHDGVFWIAIDEKPKRTQDLKRLRNIAENDSVALLFDRYDDDWSRLGFLLVGGTARVLTGEDEMGAVAALRARYPQYETMALEERPLIRVEPRTVSAWGDLSG